MGTLVMVVDDSATIRRQVGHALEEAGFAVIDAKDGVDALTQLEAGPVPSIMVCDVNMPNMNGLELLEEMQQRSGLAAVATVMLTTEGQPELIRRARRLGAKGWLVKPFRPDLLLDAVRRLEELVTG
ncbi:MAG: response regulator [Myxococcota bacterium]